MARKKKFDASQKMCSFVQADFTLIYDVLTVILLYKLLMYTTRVIRKVTNVLNKKEPKKK